MKILDESKISENSPKEEKEYPIPKLSPAGGNPADNNNNCKLLLLDSRLIDAFDISFVSAPVDHDGIFYFASDWHIADLTKVAKRLRISEKAIYLSKNNIIISIPPKHLGLSEGTVKFILGLATSDALHKKCYPTIHLHTNLAKEVASRWINKKIISKTLQKQLTAILPDHAGAKTNHLVNYIFCSKEYHPDIYAYQMKILEGIELRIERIMGTILKALFSDFHFGAGRYTIHRIEHSQDLILDGSEYNETNFLSYVANKLTSRMREHSLALGNTSFSVRINPPGNIDTHPRIKTENRNKTNVTPEYELARHRAFSSWEAWVTYMKESCATTIYFDSSHANDTKMLVQLCLYPFFPNPKTDLKRTLVRLEPRNRVRIDGKIGEKISDLVSRTAPNFTQFHLTPGEISSFVAGPISRNTELLFKVLELAGFTHKQQFRLAKGLTITCSQKSADALGPSMGNIMKRTGKGVQLKLHTDVSLIWLQHQQFFHEHQIPTSRPISTYEEGLKLLVQSISDPTINKFSDLKRMYPDFKWDVKSDRTWRRKFSDQKKVLKKDAAHAMRLQIAGGKIKALAANKPIKNI